MLSKKFNTIITKLYIDDCDFLKKWCRIQHSNIISQQCQNMFSNKLILCNLLQTINSKVIGIDSYYNNNIFNKIFFCIQDLIYSNDVIKKINECNVNNMSDAGKKILDKIICMFEDDYVFVKDEDEEINKIYIDYIFVPIFYKLTDKSYYTFDKNALDFSLKKQFCDEIKNILNISDNVMLNDYYFEFCKNIKIYSQCSSELVKYILHFSKNLNKYEKYTMESPLVLQEYELKFNDLVLKILDDKIELNRKYNLEKCQEQKNKYKKLMTMSSDINSLAISLDGKIEKSKINNISTFSYLMKYCANDNGKSVKDHIIRNGIYKIMFTKNEENIFKEHVKIFDNNYKLQDYNDKQIIKLYFDIIFVPVFISLEYDEKAQIFFDKLDEVKEDDIKYKKDIEYNEYCKNIEQNKNIEKIITLINKYKKI